MSEDEVLLRTIYRAEYFHPQWAADRYKKAVNSELRENEDGAELAAIYSGDLVTYFQTLIEQDWDIAWAESEYELAPVEDSEWFYTDKNGTLKSAVRYRFTVTVPETHAVRKDNN